MGTRTSVGIANGIGFKRNLSYSDITKDPKFKKLYKDMLYWYDVPRCGYTNEKLKELGYLEDLAPKYITNFNTLYVDALNIMNPYCIKFDANGRNQSVMVMYNKMTAYHPSYTIKIEAFGSEYFNLEYQYRNSNGIEEVYFITTPGIYKIPSCAKTSTGTGLATGYIFRNNKFNGYITITIIPDVYYNINLHNFKFDHTDGIGLYGSTFANIVTSKDFIVKESNYKLVINGTYDENYAFAIGLNTDDISAGSIFKFSNVNVKVCLLANIVPDSEDTSTSYWLDLFTGNKGEHYVSDGEYTVVDFDKEHCVNYQLKIYAGTYKNMTIEIIPRYNGLVFDGIDDYCMINVDMSENFTIFYDIDWLTPYSRAGFYTDNLFYMYNYNISNLLYHIRTSSFAVVVNKNAIAFTSDGDVYYKDLNTNKIRIGTNTRKNANLYLGFGNNVYAHMVLRKFLCFNRILTDSEIKYVIKNLILKNK